MSDLEKMLGGLAVIGWLSSTGWWWIAARETKRADKFTNLWLKERGIEP